jgi:hypothetical protein
MKIPTMIWKGETVQFLRWSLIDELLDCTHLACGRIERGIGASFLAARRREHSESESGGKKSNPRRARVNGSFQRWLLGRALMACMCTKQSHRYGIVVQ